MFRRLTMSLAAVTLALTTALPTPAAAMSDKDRQLLTLLLGAVVVGAIVHDANKKKKKSVPQVSRNYHDHAWRDDDDDDDDDWRDWRRDHRWRNRTVPAECVFSLRGGYGRRDVVSARCLEEYGMRRNLPGECAFNIDAGWGSRKVYGTRCLRQNGYRIAGGR